MRPRLAPRPSALKLGMDARDTIAAACIAVDPLDVVDEFTVGGGSLTLRPRAPGIIASRRDPEHIAQDCHRIVGAAIFNEAESHFGTPATAHYPARRFFK